VNGDDWLGLAMLLWVGRLEIRCFGRRHIMHAMSLHGLVHRNHPVRGQRSATTPNKPRMVGIGFLYEFMNYERNVRGWMDGRLI